MNENVTVRPIDPDLDLPYIFASWLNCHKNESRFGRPIPREIFFREHHLIIEHILNIRKAEVLIAADSREPNLILGFLVHEPGLIHFCYTKKPFRNMKVMKTLIDAAKIDLENTSFSHWTYDADFFVHKFPKMTYNPYAI